MVYLVVFAFFVARNRRSRPFLRRTLNALAANKFTAPKILFASCCPPRFSAHRIVAPFIPEHACPVIEATLAKKESGHAAS
jgi:hypothetical protein